jgi:hypothetical protein
VQRLQGPLPMADLIEGDGLTLWGDGHDCQAAGIASIETDRDPCSRGKAKR